jgi:hypothetical protein
MPEPMEIRPARFRCLKNGHVFEKEVWQVGPTVAEQNEPAYWKVDDPDAVRCPECGSRVEVLTD